MMTRADVLRKVRSLLALAALGSGATEPERASARSKADALMAAHGLREGDIPAREVARAVPPPPPVVQPFVRVFVGGFGFSFGVGDNSFNTATTTGTGNY